MKTRIKKRSLSLLLVIAMVLTLCPVGVFAADRDTSKSQVHVVVENTTFKKADGAKWDGTLVDTWIDLDSNSTAMSCIDAAIKGAGYTVTGTDGNYISEINGLAQMDGGNMSGWMGTINDWFTSEGFSAYKVSNNTLTANDEIRVMYSCDMGVDLGGSYDDNTTTLRSIEFSKGGLSKSFTSDGLAYTLIIPEDVKTLTVRPTANNKNFQVHTRVGDKVYKIWDEIPVSEGTEIKVTCGDGASMNAGATPTTYTFTVAYKTVPTSTVNASFDKTEASIAEGEKVTLTLKDESSNPIAGATIIVNDIETTDVTDENGQVTITFNEKGSYTLGAIVKSTKTGTTANCKVEVVGVVSSGTENGVNYKVMSDGVCYLEATPEANGKVKGSYWSKPWNDASIKKYVVKEGATYVGDYAFNGVDVSEIVLPSTVTTIGQRAFCSSTIGNLVIPEGVTSIAEYGFYNAEITGKLTLPSTLKTCMSRALYNCNIKGFEAAEGCYFSVSDGIVYTENGTSAFFLPDAENYTGELVFKEGCTKLEGDFRKVGASKVVLPSTVTSYSNNLFYGSPNLKEVEVGCNLDSNSFNNCTALEKVVVKEGVTKLGSNVFHWCNNIKEIELPASLKELDGYTFISATAIDSIKFAEGSSLTLKDNMIIKDGKEIVLSVKKNMTGHLVIPEGITKIGGAAFSGAPLTEVTLPNSLEKLGGDVFYNCSNLVKVNFGTEQKLKTIGECAFQTTALTSIAFPEGVETIGAYILDSCGSLTDVSFPSTLKTLGNMAFRNCTSLKNLEVPVSLGKQSCEGCTNLVKVTLKEGVTSVGENAFKNCTSLTTLKLPTSLTNISRLAFTGCSSIANIENFEGASWKIESGMLISGTSVKLMLTKAENVVIPEGITEIGAEVFYEDTTIKSVKLPSTLQVIGENAFCRCTIESVTIPGSVKTIGYTAFYNCYQMKKVTVEKGAILGEGTFSNCNEVRELVLPEGLEEIPKECFIDCSKVETINLPSTVKKIGNNAFRGCSKLATMNLPDGLEELGEYALYGTSLASVTIPAGVKKPGYNFVSSSDQEVTIDFRGAEEIEFVGAYNTLEKLYLPASLKVLKENLKKHKNLKIIFFRGTKEQWDAIDGIEEVKKNLPANNKKGFDTVVVYNYSDSGNGNGETIQITKQPEGGTFGRGMKNATLTCEANAPEDATVFYNWYEDGKLNASYGNSNTITADTSKEGTKKIYCEITAVKDGKYSVVKTNEVTVNIVSREAGVFKGTGTEEDPYLIETTEAIKALSEIVADGESYEGKFFKLACDITLPENWAPIGCTKDGKHDINKGANMNAFSGTFDGAGHTVMVPAGEKPLFAYVHKATIKNLNIFGEKIEGYGLVNNFEGVGLNGTGVVIDNVILKSGTKTLKSGLIGGVITTNSLGASSYGHELVIKNCTIEKDVVVGYDGNETNIGSFAGRCQGTIENCVSHATVKGVDYVGGIVSMKDNAMGVLLVRNCTFDGEIIASGSNVGGILGGVYNNSTAPNAIRASIEACTVSGTVTGKENVGGILGGDTFVAQAWNAYHITDNFFNGKVSGEKNVGAIFGYYKSLNKWDDITGNKYTEGCGATKAFGAVEYVDTNIANPTPVEGVLYFSTENDTKNCPAVTGCNWKVAHNRADDPLGKDASKLAVLVKPADAKGVAEKVATVSKETAEYVSGLTTKFGAEEQIFGSEWTVIGLARSETTPKNEMFYRYYYNDVVRYVKEHILEGEKLSNSLSTETSRLVLALTALGYNPTDVAGHNLLKALSSMTFVKKQGINGPIWALIALDSKGYEIPTNDDTEDQVTRDKLIDAILASRLECGGWDFTPTAKTADPDMTGMALQALAPYYNKRADVKEAVDKSLTLLSEMQNEDGGFSTWGTATSESASQVLVALTALGIDPVKDTRFIKNGKTVVDALCDYAVENGGFKHVATGDLNGMATDQGFYAITAYNRFVSGKTSLYDMSDVQSRGGSTEASNNVYKMVEKAVDMINNMATTDKEEFVANVVELVKAYEALTEEEKASLAADVKDEIAKAQNKAGEINHKAGDIKVSGIDWNVKINVKLFEPASEEAKKIEAAAAKDYKNEKVLIIYDLSLTDVLTGAGTEPGANGITITLPAPEGTKDFDHVIIAHLRADGVVEYVEAKVKDGEMTFILKSLSPVAVVGYNKGEVLNEEITSNGDTTPDAAVTTQDATLVKSPVTGDPIAAILFVYATLMILCAGGFVVALRRKAR